MLFVIGSLGLGGAETQLALLMRELTRRGWGCHLFVLEATGPLREQLLREGIPIYDGGYRSTATYRVKLLLLLRALFRLWWLAWRSRYDVLHAYLPLTNFLGVIAGRMARVPRVISSRRALGTHQDRHPLWRWFDRWANSWSHRVLVNSEAVGEDTIARDGIKREKLALIPNALDLSQIDMINCSRASMRASLGLDNSQFAIASVGNLIGYKGHADLLDAFAQVHAVYPDTCLMLVGEDRGIGAELQARAQALSVIHCTYFLGRRHDVPSLLNAMDLFVLPSHEEGFSNALLEAMAVGLPVIATDVGGNPEAVGDVGVLVPVRQPEMLASAILSLIANEKMRQKLARAAKAKVRHVYKLDAMVAAQIAIYQGRDGHDQ